MKRLTTSEFIKKAKKVHGNAYDYSKSIYIKSNQKITIICKKHGEFLQIPNRHLSGSGCPKCGVITKIKKKSSNTNEFIEKAKKIHGDKYDYSRVNYIKGLKEIKIYCNKCKEYFYQKPKVHLKNHGCFRCNGGKLLNIEEFTKRAIQIHGNKYDYSKTKYISFHEKIIIICKKHGEFKQSSAKHLNGQGCPICNESHGERKIRNWLDKNNIHYENQKRFKNCFNLETRQCLKFDFYLSDYNILIEYNGEQHYKVSDKPYWKDNTNKLENRKYLDNLKKKFSKKYDIKLIIIPYYEINKIESILNEKILKYNKIFIRTNVLDFV